MNLFAKKRELTFSHMPDVKNENTDTSIPSEKGFTASFLYNPQKYYKYIHNRFAMQTYPCLKEDI